MAGQRTKGFQFPTGAFGDFASNIVRAGQYEGAGIEALLSGIGRGISNRRDRKDRAEREAKDEAYRRDVLAAQEARAARDDARQDAALDLTRQRFEFEKAKTSSALLDKAANELKQQQAMAELYRQLGQPEAAADADARAKQMEGSVGGLAMKLESLPAAPMAQEVPDSLASLKVRADQANADIRRIESAMQEATKDGRAQDVRRLGRMLAVRRKEAESFMVRAEAETNRQKVEAQKVLDAKDAADTALAANEVSDTLDQLARVRLGIQDETADLPMDVATGIQAIVDGIRGKAIEPTAGSVELDKVLSAHEGRQPGPTEEQQIQEAGVRGRVDAARETAKNDAMPADSKPLTPAARSEAASRVRKAMGEQDTAEFRKANPRKDASGAEIPVEPKKGLASLPARDVAIALVSAGRDDLARQIAQRYVGEIGMDGWKMKVPDLYDKADELYDALPPEEQTAENVERIARALGL